MKNIHSLDMYLSLLLYIYRMHFSVQNGYVAFISLLYVQLRSQLIILHCFRISNTFSYLLFILFFYLFYRNYVEKLILV